jgi:hypothetical protein
VQRLFPERHAFASARLFPFSEDIRPRILGITALTERTSASYINLRREEEIISWLYANSSINLPWAALDDSD